MRLDELNELYLKSQKGSSIDNNHLIQVMESLAQASKAGILLIIDELGKNLEFSAQNQSMDDLYLLQQIAELPSNRDGFNVSVFGLLAPIIHRLCTRNSFGTKERMGKDPRKVRRYSIYRISGSDDATYRSGD